MVEGRYSRPLTNRRRGQVPRNYRVRGPTRQDDGQSAIWAISLEFRCLCRVGPDRWSWLVVVVMLVIVVMLAGAIAMMTAAVMVTVMTVTVVLMVMVMVMAAV